MFNNLDLFTNSTPNTQTIKLADGSTIHSAGTGTVKIELPHCFLELKNCLLVKSLAYNLISLGAIMNPNFKITTNKNKTFNSRDQNNNLTLNGTYSSEGIFLGYEEGHRAYQILEGRTGNVTISHNVQFFPDIFPHKLDPIVETNHSSLADVEPSCPIITSPKAISLEAETRILEPPENELTNKEEILPTKTSRNTKTKKHYEWIPEDCPPPKEIHGEVGNPTNIIDSSQRQKHSANYAKHSLEEDPKTYQQAMNCNFSDEWSKAIQTELDNMERHCVWSPTTKSSEAEKPLLTTWVFKQKIDKDGNLNKFKAHLCVRGFHQREEPDYGDVYSPTGRLTSLRLLPTLCHINNFPIEQMDVKCTFLNGKPDKELYIKRPNGYNKYKPTKYFKLNQSLYGLKQSPRCWHKELKNTLSKMVLCPSQSDPCLFYSPNSNKQMLLYVHVDDLIFGGSWNNEFKTTIKTHFDIDE
ncbi:hypothetical protein O181_009504 [Austropuccinia psidii MF-1]|uniref:Reverse transcriptase Ty1/copia-type domain-containing protein n=1 Tax=Austropuccinia psidii MF-1 TaxID=1389203 RepID=A0A9Q3BQY0_9BASI|nr:hypothetical protein [Austropuccinia psidii MF-1]